jgi:hypothetical protein
LILPAFLLQKSGGAEIGLDSALERVSGRGERQHERKRRIEHRQSAIAFVPAHDAIVLGVNQQSDAADILHDADAAIGGAAYWEARQRERRSVAKTNSPRPSRTTKLTRLPKVGLL